jgi:hypothetical protein
LVARTLELGFCVLGRAQTDCAPEATAARQLGYCCERRLGGAVVLQQLAKSDGTDVLGAS